MRCSQLTMLALAITAGMSCYSGRDSRLVPLQPGEIRSGRDAGPLDTVVFVIDMPGGGWGLVATRGAVEQVLTSMPARSRVGLVVADGAQPRISPGSVHDNRPSIVQRLRTMRSFGYQTALYDVVAEAVQLADEADDGPGSRRGIIVITRGVVHQGRGLDSLAHMVSTDGMSVKSCPSPQLPMLNQPMLMCNGREGQAISLTDVVGTELAVHTRHPVWIHYLLVRHTNGRLGSESLQHGRILAEASGGSYRDVPGEYTHALQGNLTAVMKSLLPVR